MAIAYGAAGSEELAFKGDNAQWVNNAYSVSRSMSADEIDVTAFGDYPFKATESGFIDFSIDISLRHGIRSGDLAPDVAFFEMHALTRTPFRIAIVDDRKSTAPNGMLMTVIATQADTSGEATGAQDNKYTLKLASGGLPPARIVGGVATPIEFST
jgi:hypothetical protein